MMNGRQATVWVGIMMIAIEAGSQSITSIGVAPPNPAQGSLFQVQVSGTFPTTGYSVFMDCDPLCYTNQGDTDYIRILYAPPPGGAGQVITPWGADVAILGKPAGGYHVVVTLGNWTNSSQVVTARTSYVVGQTTVTSASWIEEEVTIQWSGVSSLRYSVEETTNVSQGGWRGLSGHTNMPGTGSMTCIAPVTNGSGALRVVITPE